ncbi:hypothetical protein O9992_18305 [Vibrio lentus]|nr:hypothetical protein [Vibrio lentus]
MASTINSAQCSSRYRTSQSELGKPCCQARAKAMQRYWLTIAPTQYLSAKCRWVDNNDVVQSFVDACERRLNNTIVLLHNMADAKNAYIDAEAARSNRDSCREGSI